MSYKGFVKAVSRLPHTITKAAGYTKETVDTDFNYLNESLVMLDGLAKKLSDDATKYKDSLSAMLTHQATFAETLVEAYGSLTVKRSINAQGAIEQLSTSSLVTAQQQESINQATEFSTAMSRIKDLLLPELDNLERNVVGPARDFARLVNNVKKTIIKRSHKMTDYDRHRESFKKLSEKTDRDIKEEKKLGAFEIALDQATREYTDINNLLLRELPLLLALRIQFIDPCFQTLYWYQVKVYQKLSDEFATIVTNQFPGTLTALEGFNLHEENMLEMLASLSLIKRPFRSSLTGNVIEENRASSDPDALPAYTLPASSSTTTAVLPVVDKTPGFSTIHDKIAPKLYTSGNSSSTIASSPGGINSGKRFVVALYDYSSDTPGDLAFKRDDRIEVIKQTDTSGWWIGRINGVEGAYPGNYVVDSTTTF